MKYIRLIMIVSLLGCAAKEPVVIPSVESEALPAILETQEARGLQNIDEEQLDAYEVKTGVIFAKTDFKGVLEKTYVKLSFENLENIDNKFNLYIGDKSNQQAFLWDAEPVKPGYFFIELPVGKYKISSISIPVGSTLATEKMDITLEVLEEKVIYVGTLFVNGIKEKIKLGGLPVLKPGFEYQVGVINEKDEAMEIFQQRYPKFRKEITVGLMEVHLTDNRQDYGG